MLFNEVSSSFFLVICVWEFFHNSNLKSLQALFFHALEVTDIVGNTRDRTFLFHIRKFPQLITS